MKKLIYHILFFLVFGITNAKAGDTVSIIPQPVSVRTNGGSFVLPEKIVIGIGSPSVRDLGLRLESKLKLVTGRKVSVREKNAGTATIRLLFNDTVNATLGDEGYDLDVTKSGITIRANKPAGIFYGIQTLYQLMPPQIESPTPVKNISWKLPTVQIEDYPRFAWRGILFDVSRHFFTKDEVKGFIDNMVKFKYNLLHLHLTDDQGWRIEIKSLPKLTEVGAWRAPRVGIWKQVSKPAPDEPRTYGGFYTQEDMKEIITYAASRFVNIMPEIDVPGHSLAAVAAYPELSCTPGNYQVNSGELLRYKENGKAYSLLDNTLCPANDRVYVFLDKVFTELAQLFPFQYVHIGGDECYKGYWEKSQACKNLMKREGLKTEEELQSYFIKRVENIVQSKGKKIIGWDEILEGGLAPGAAVMSWRGIQGGVEAARMKHKVVMTPNTFAYFDLYQGDPVAEPPTYSMLRLKKAYGFEPVPPGVDPEYILGGQCNLWSERLTTMRHAEYMLWPRGLASAECLWSPVSEKKWNWFYRKVEKQFDRFDAAQTKYSRSMYDPIFSVSKDQNDSLVIELKTEIDGLDIYYSFDETEPDNFYPKYKTPLLVPKDAAHLKVVTYRDGQQVGKLISMPIEELRNRLEKKEAKNS